MINKVRLSDICSTVLNTELSLEHIGENPFINNIAAVENCQQGDLTFATTQEYLDEALSKKPAAVVVPPKLLEAAQAVNNLGVLVTNNVKLAHALIKQAYADRDYIDEQWQKIHPSAVIHKTATIPKSCFISPNVTIGQNTVIGENCKILAGVVIENDVTIGDDCIFHPNSVIGYKSKIGNKVEIGACTVLGAEGFGFAQDSKGKSYKIPQTGHVVIEDNVLLGAFNTIDRAVYEVTTIGEGTKTDNIVHIAHNVTIGKDCLFTPMLAVAGSATIGDRCITSGQSQVSDHINICDDVMLVHRAGVTKDITESGMYSSMPLRPFKQYMKDAVQVSKLSRLNKKVKALERALKALQTTD